MRIVSPACWRGGAEAAMWFIAATRRRGPAGGTGNPAGRFLGLSDSAPSLGPCTPSSPRSPLAAHPHHNTPSVKKPHTRYYNDEPSKTTIRHKQRGCRKKAPRFVNGL